MPISFQEVSNYVNDVKDNLKSVMDTMSRSILNARDDQNLPVYSIKSRIKSAESAYLKTKRKNYLSLDKITDYAGLRILCLFERNIFDINSFLLDYFKRENIQIEEVKVFNFDDHSFDKIKQVIVLHDYNFCLQPLVHKKSGYKSVHYLVSTQIVGKQVKIEMQLRTLLQDVWGELEHSLSYKRGGIHPHIKKSFELLSQDLQTADTLMEHLKDINEKEEGGERYSNDKSGPRDYLDYEDELLPEIFKDNLKTEYEAYHSFVKEINLRDKTKYTSNVIKLKELYDIIASKITAVQLRDDKLYYWHEMEKALYLFCESNYTEALKIYTDLKFKYKDKYCLHFRTGELYMKLGEVQKALTEFDDAESLISACKLPFKNKNLYDIKVMLSLVYWMLGDEYIDIALTEIIEAETIYHQNEEELNGKIKLEALINNVCWYHLAKFIITQDEADLIAALQKFKALEELLEEDKEKAHLSCNTLDTSAWFYYNKFLFKKDPEDAKRAIECCLKMKERFNYTSFNFSSIHVQFNHIKEIMSLKI